MLDALVKAGCPACKQSQLRLRALQRATLRVMDGEPVSSLKWQDEPLEPRVYRVECVACGQVVLERDLCPLCQARGALPRVLKRQNGIPVPRACPRCALEELDLTVEVRMHIETLHGHLSRRRADAEPHEPAFHVVEARCPDCEEVVAAVGDARCAACGRSALLRRL